MAAMVSQLDAKIGQFVAALEKTGQRQNTLIVFTSDNGGIESLTNAYVGKVAHSPLNSENDPLRAQKGTLYEGGVRVCAFANWPGKLTPRKHTSPMHAVDWFPTLAALTGYRPAEDLKWDGINQWPALTGAEPAKSPRTIYIAATGGHALRHGDWKLVVSKQGQPQLFQLVDDPYEKTDLASKQPEKVAELQQLMAAHQAQDEPKLPADLQGLPK
jgi:arylsulfatase A-like enzyme